jgi:hypothetical protein
VFEYALFSRQNPTQHQNTSRKNKQQLYLLQCAKEHYYSQAASLIPLPKQPQKGTQCFNIDESDQNSAYIVAPTLA